ncbi:MULTISPECIES: restriction system-associated AAA family ATPase [Chryseobacterium]|uniref:restriction system-associated AAA family ATPase n=1 Tax=Chryseobacterium TaxID=59732 RepID=UPI00195E2EA4|nr:MULTISPECIES: restriction system-associated AAA family ATPase [Chryseobacterium]MBM7420461.1 restriction system-associated AAA family ATPase [Chryseobacterium sp. JUb44]MDH6210410.1 restriction system-associated AAA family ATPase [Chryseobacterium sp. BIGb0186]WSO09111.1 restriction system-associated AAA family ATPase [Chryseobacterium scophthalmum]
MKLKSLKLHSQFRSLQAGFEIDFLNEQNSDKLWDFMPYCLVGRNGSGKSNILEVLAEIFYHIECIYLDFKPNGFNGEGKFKKVSTDGFFAESCNPDAFELEYYYYINGNYPRKNYSSDFNIGYDAHIKIEKKINESPKVYWLNRKECVAIETTLLERIEVKDFLPDFIVAYSSGENQIINLPFFKMRFIQYDEYLYRLVKDLDYIKPESRFVYLDEYYNQAVLLSIYLLRDKKTLAPFKKELGLDDIKSFRLIIKQDQFEKVHSDVFKTIPQEDKKDKSKITRELTSLVSKSIERLKACSTTSYFKHDTKELILDYFVNKECREAFKFHFADDAFELFRTFQVLLNLNNCKTPKKIKEKVYHSKNIYINQDVIPLPYDEERIFKFKEVVLKKDKVDEVIYTKSLSDGEYQFIHSIGLCLLFRDTNSLFLLDEPETHFNPDWRSNFISTLRDCLKQDEVGSLDNRRDLLITSHSPFIVSDCQPENVIIFDKQNKKVEHQTAKDKGIRTFGTSANILTEDIFGKKESISKLSLEIIERIKNMPLNSPEEILAAKEEARILGESVEKVLLFRELIIKENELNKLND